jgi:hypothetical protein
MNEVTADTTVNESVESLSEEVNSGFAENGQRFDQIANLILDSNVDRSNEYNAILAAVNGSDESADEGEQSEQTDDVYEVLLTSIDERLSLQNDILQGEIFMFGVICGILLFKILWDKLRI